MKILLVARQELYERLKKPFLEQGLEIASVCSNWDDLMSAMKAGIDALVIDEGVSISDNAKSLPYPKLVYSGNRDYPERVKSWIEGLKLANERAKSNPMPLVKPSESLPAAMKDSETNQPAQGSESENKEELHEHQEIPHSVPETREDRSSTPSITSRVTKVVSNTFQGISVPNPLKKLARGREEKRGRTVVIGGNSRVGKTWVLSSLFGTLAGRGQIVAVDRDGTLSALWGIAPDVEIAHVKGKSVIAKIKTDDDLLDLQKRYDVVILEVDNFEDWLHAGYNAIFVVDCDPFNYQQAVNSEWNKKNWEGQLTVVINRTPYELPRRYTGHFEAHLCYQITNQALPLYLLYQAEEPVLQITTAFRRFVNDLLDKSRTTKVI